MDAFSMAPSYTMVLLKTAGTSDDEAPCSSDDDAFWLSHNREQPQVNIHKLLLMQSEKIAKRPTYITISIIHVYIFMYYVCPLVLRS